MGWVRMRTRVVLAASVGREQLAITRESIARPRRACFFSVVTVLATRPTAHRDSGNNFRRDGQ